MDGGRFDAWARGLASRVSRRGALGVASAAGAGALAGAALGPDAAVAQTSRRTVTCEWRIEAEISTGPNRGNSYDGLLTVVIDRDGFIDDATLELDVPGDPRPVYVGVGMANGRSIDLRLEGGECEVLAFTGVGDDSLSRCDVLLAGSFQGPALTDLGGWRTHPDAWCREGETWDERACTCVEACASEEPCPDGESWDPTTCRCTPGQEDDACPGVVCRGNYRIDTGTCQCYCPSDACGGDGSGWYLNADTCSCSCELTKCPEGQEVDRELCACVCAKQTCDGNQVWDPYACQCACPDDPCPAPYYRDSISCQCLCDPVCFNGAVVDTETCSCVCPTGAGLTYCDGDLPYCTDLLTDIDNCGSCGNSCATGYSCIGGTCLL